MGSRLVGLIGRPELLDDPRFNSPAARRANWPALQEVLRVWLATFESVDKAVQTLAGARIPSVPMLTAEEVVAHPHMAARQAFPILDHPTRKDVRVTAPPFHLDGRPLAPAGPAPYRIGQDTRAVLTGVLGYSTDQVESLAGDRVVEIAS